MSDQAGRDDVLELATPTCAVDDVGDEVVVLNVETGMYFSIRELGVPVWRALAGGHTPAQVAASLSSDAEAGLAGFVEQLKEHGLLRVVPGGVAAEVLPELPPGAHEIVFEAYGDIQDLLLSDPIHDVDRLEGWPKASA